VGRVLIQEMERSRLPVNQLRLWATARSAGCRIPFRGRRLSVREIDPAEFIGCQLIFFSGTEGEKGASRLYARQAVDSGSVVIDNGSDFRLDPKVPLVIPEVNARDLKSHRGLIANPNCSTIQMVAALAPIHRRFGLRRVVVSTYQSVSGAGRSGLEALAYETANPKSSYAASPFAQRIAGNAIPDIGGLGEMEYTTEEWKMVREARKILHDPKLSIAATAVRVPVAVGHAEAIYFETRKKVSLGRLRTVLAGAPGIIYDRQGYRTPLEVAGRDGVFVSRLRPVPGSANSFLMWCLADNIRKGAATNAVQIAQLLYSQGMLPGSSP
jgi:aspartate-semialdehyde dehydrogenase